MQSSKKITIIAFVCLFSLATVVYVKAKPRVSSTEAKMVDLTITPTTQSSATLQAIQEKIAPPAENSGQPSLTDKISQDFVEKYTSLAQNGSWNTDSQAQLITDLASNYGTTSPHGLALSDLSTFSDLDKEKIHIFGNTVAKTVLQYYNRLKKSPLDILAQAQADTNASTTLLTELAPLSTTYRAMALDLQKIPAPANLAANYLSMINGYISVADSIDDMQRYYVDPVRGMRGISSYEKIFVDQAELLKTIANYFNSNGILFSNTDTGAIWNSL